MVLDSSTVMTPSLPTFSMASAIVFPISESLLAETDATSEISSLSLISLEFFLISSTAISTALSMPRFSSMGVMPAATDLRPSLTSEYAKDGGCSGSVTGDVIGLGGDFLEELRAHVLVGVGKLDFLRDGDAVPW